MIPARAAILSGPNAPFELSNVVIQNPNADEVLVKISGVGVCHTDLVCKGAFPLALPVVLGHEGSGVVEAVGSSVKSISPGDHVVLTFASCGGCANCQKDAPANCFAFMAENFWGTRADGSTPMTKGDVKINARFFGQSSFATYAIANERNAVVISKAAPIELMGPLGCGIQTGAGAVLNSLAVGKDHKIAIFGGGAVGLSAVMAAKIAGASSIVLVEPNADRRALGSELGATHVVDSGAGNAGAAITAATGGVTHALDTTGIPAVMSTACDVLLPKGVLGILGFSPPDANLPLNIMSILTRGITIKGIIEGDADPKTFIPKLVTYYLSGKLPIERLIKKYPLEAINSAFEDTGAGRVIKPIIIPA